MLDKNQLLHHFNQAADVERVVFELASTKSIDSNHVVGSYLDLRLDKSQNAICFLTVSSNDEDWMNISFSEVKEELYKNKNHYSLFRNKWVGLLIQIFGIFLGFLVSLWGAANISPFLDIENSFLISFLLVLFVFSNLWTPINNMLHNFVFAAFPTVKFYRPNKYRLNWLYQTLIGGLVVAGTIFLLNLAFDYVGKMLGAFVGSGT